MKHLLTAAALLAFATTPSLAHEAKETLMPEDPEALAFQDAVGFSDAVIHGDTIFMSGVVAVPQEGDVGMEPAFTRAFERLGHTLERLGASWEDVIVFETFHTGSIAAQVEAFVEVKNRYIKAPFPAWTAIGVTELYETGALVEIKLTVRKPVDPAE